MKNLLIIFLCFIAMAGYSQSDTAKAPKLDKKKFFADEETVQLKMETDYRKLFSGKAKSLYQPATATLVMPDSTSFRENIELRSRGNFRKENCYMPSIMLNFKPAINKDVKKLGTLKLVVGCRTGDSDEQLIMKEYLVYKMYNLLTEKSFRVRLLSISYSDTKEKIKPYTQYGFFIEDVDDMAKRNDCVKVEGRTYQTEMTNRQLMTLTAIFQYLIGNTDWSVPVYHNIRLMRSKRDSFSLPYAIPYDFDYCGLVNASYAIPTAELGISSVRERLYRGFPRTITELQEALTIFREKKEAMYKLVNDCAQLNQRNKKETISYLDEFYKMIEKKNEVEYNFIDKARKQ